MHQSEAEKWIKLLNLSLKNIITYFAKNRPNYYYTLPMIFQLFPMISYGFPKWSIKNIPRLLKIALVLCFGNWLAFVCRKLMGTLYGTFADMFSKSWDDLGLYMGLYRGRTWGEFCVFACIVDGILLYFWGFNYS